MIEMEKKIGDLVWNPKRLIKKTKHLFKGKFHNIDIAVKSLKQAYKNKKEDFLSLSKLSHANIVRIFCVEQYAGSLFIGEDLCEFDLTCFLNCDKKKLNMDMRKLTALKICKDITEGLNYLHSKDHIHNNLHTRNVLIGKDGCAKLSDSGLVKHFVRTDFLAPEVEIRNSSSFTKSANVFSLGLLFHYVLSNGHNLFLVRKSEGRILTTDEPVFSDMINLKESWKLPLANEIIKYMISLPEKRPRCENILKHPLFWTEYENFEFFQTSFEYMRSPGRPAYWKYMEIDAHKILIERSDDTVETLRLNQCKCVEELLKIMSKNLKFHEKNLTTVQNGQHITFWLSKFPLLLRHIYHVLASVLSDLITDEVQKLQKFYPHDKFQAPENFNQIEVKTVESKYSKNALKLEINRNYIEFDEKKIHGKGNSNVFEGWRRKHGNRKTKVAVKKVSLSDSPWKEINTLADLRCDNIVKFYGWSKFRKDFNLIILEPAVCNLDEYLKNKETQFLDLKSRLNEKQILRDCLNGVNYVHSKKYLHLDLKPRNVLIIDDGTNARAVIADFDKSIQNKKDSRFLTATKTNYGTHAWTSPEIVKLKDEQDDKYDEFVTKITNSSDIFVLGMIFFYVLNNRKHLFGFQDNNISKACHQWQPNLIIENKLTIQLIRDMTRKNPDKRPGADEILQHPWFWSSEKSKKFFLYAHKELERLKNDPREIMKIEDESIFKKFIIDWTSNVDDIIMSDLKASNMNVDGKSLINIVSAIAQMIEKYDSQDFAATKNFMSKQNISLIDYWLETVPDVLWVAYFRLKKYLESNNDFYVGTKFTQPTALPKHRGRTPLKRSLENSTNDGPKIKKRRESILHVTPRLLKHHQRVNFGKLSRKSSASTSKTEAENVSSEPLMNSAVSRKITFLEKPAQRVTFSQSLPT